jgi:hypothetical protein
MCQLHLLTHCAHIIQPNPSGTHPNPKREEERLQPKTEKSAPKGVKRAKRTTKTPKAYEWHANIHIERPLTSKDSERTVEQQRKMPTLQFGRIWDSLHNPTHH